MHHYVSAQGLFLLLKKAGFFYLGLIENQVIEQSTAALAEQKIM